MLLTSRQLFVAHASVVTQLSTCSRIVMRMQKCDLSRGLYQGNQPAFHSDFTTQVAKIETFENILNDCCERNTMMKRTTNVVGRASLAAALIGTLSFGASGVASAQANDRAPHHDGGSSQGHRFGDSIAHSGIVTALSSRSIVVEGPVGTSTTYSLSASTTFSEGDQMVSQSSLNLGERVVIRTSSITSTSALSVDVVLVHLAGRVTSVSGNAVTIVDAEGFSRAIEVSSITTYDENGNAATLTNVVVGSKIDAVGTVDADETSLDARMIYITSPITTRIEIVNGTVTALSVDSITLSVRDNDSATFAITASTSFKQGDVDATQAALVLGDQVTLRATVVSDSATNTSISTADSIDVHLSRVDGVVTGVTNGVILVAVAENLVRSIVVSAATSYSENGNVALLADVTVGTTIEAQGTMLAGSATLSALLVNIDVDQHLASSPSDKAPDNSRHGYSNQPETGFGHSGTKGRH
jgi:hypothetical protein